MIKRILVPLDGSKLAEMALPHAIAMARANKFGITLLQVTPQPVFAHAVSWAFAPSATVFEGWAEEVNAETRYLARVAACLRKQDLDI